MLTLNNLTIFLFYPALSISLLYLLNCIVVRGFVQIFGWNFYIVTGIVGVFVHETSHALVALIFRHTITEYKPFYFDRASGVLGYVSHAFNKRDVSQVVGIPFIAVAPLFLGSLLIYALMNYLVGNSSDINDHIIAVSKAFETISIASFNEGAQSMLDFINSFFASENFRDPSFWIFGILAFSISTHLVPSNHDFKIMLPSVCGLGFFFFLIVKTTQGTEGLIMIERYIFWMVGIFNGIITIAVGFAVLQTVLALCAAIVYKIFRSTPHKENLYVE